MNGHVTVIGSLNADLVVRVPRFPAAGETLTGLGFARFPGGKGANQAYAAARMGAPTTMIGQVGDDDLGRWLTGHLAAGGVDVRDVRRSAEGTGLALITIDGAGQNQIVLVPGANGAFTPDRLPSHSTWTNGVRVLLLQLEVPIATVIEAAKAGRAGGALVVLDPAPAVPLPAELVSLVDLLTPNETELAIITGGGTVSGEDDIRRRAGDLQRMGASSVIVKCGAGGARLYGALGERAWSARPVTAVDTTAAGDTFNGALAAALAHGQDVDSAGRLAVAAATLSVTRSGAQPSMPGAAEVAEWIAAGP